MLVASLATPLLGSLPYAITRSISPEWNEVSKFCLGFLVLSALFGYWLNKGEALHNDLQLLN